MSFKVLCRDRVALLRGLPRRGMVTFGHPHLPSAREMENLLSQGGKWAEACSDSTL